MLCCQFLCHVLKAIFFITIAQNLSYFCKKLQKVQALGLRPQTPSLWRLGTLPPDSKSSPRHCEFLATRLDERILPPLPVLSSKEDIDVVAN